MEANASPRNPKLCTDSRSSRSLILLVACRLNERGKSSFSIPKPLSRIRINFTPPCSTSTSIRVAPASKLFSTNSFTTLAGRSTTSPAAIWLARRGLKTSIRFMVFFSNWMNVQRLGGWYFDHLANAYDTGF